MTKAGSFQLVTRKEHVKSKKGSFKVFKVEIISLLNVCKSSQPRLSRYWGPTLNTRRDYGK